MGIRFDILDGAIDRTEILDRHIHRQGVAGEGPAGDLAAGQDQAADERDGTAAVGTGNLVLGHAGVGVMGVDLSELAKAVQLVVGGVQLALESGNLALCPADGHETVGHGELAEGEGGKEDQNDGGNADLEVDRLFIAHGEVDAALGRELAALSAGFAVRFLSKGHVSHLPISSVTPIAWARMAQLSTLSPEGTSSSMRWMFMPTVSAMVLQRG